MAFKPSKYQQAFFTWIEKGVGNAELRAVAGSGKTTTAVQAMNLIPTTKRVLFLAFNKNIAEELKKRAPRHADCMTLNSLGHRAWARFLGKQPTLNKGKTALAMGEALNEIEIYKYGKGVAKLVALAKSQGIVPSDVRHATSLTADTLDVWLDLIDFYDIDVCENPTDKDAETAIGLARKVLTVSCSHPNTIDFDDQLYLTVAFGANPPKYDWIFVDEAQDLSPVQQRLVELCVADGGRVAIIGDENQAIYGFRGADSNSLSNFGARLGATSLPLSICYRCPKSHIELAQKFVPAIEAAPDAIEGEILDFGSKWDAKAFNNDDLIICRNSAPLIKMAYALLAQKVAVRILGRDLGSGLVSLIKKLKARSTDDLIARLDAWKDKQIERAKRKDKDANTDKFTDRVETILTFIDMFPTATPETLCREIESLYSDDTRGILTLATVHKSKGLEADRVFILNDYLMPSKHAKKPWQQRQEANLQYISRTRAKHTLGFVEIDMRKSKP